MIKKLTPIPFACKSEYISKLIISNDIWVETFGTRYTIPVKAYKKLVDIGNELSTYIAQQEQLKPSDAPTWEAVEDVIMGYIYDTKLHKDVGMGTHFYCDGRLIYLIPNSTFYNVLPYMDTDDKQFSAKIKSALRDLGIQDKKERLFTASYDVLTCYSINGFVVIRNSVNNTLGVGLHFTSLYGPGVGILPIENSNII